MLAKSITKLTTPDEFLKLAVAWLCLQKAPHHQPASGPMFLPLTPGVLERLARAYHDYVAAIGQDMHHNYYRFADLKGDRLGKRLHNLDNTGLANLGYNPTSQSSNPDRLVFKLSVGVAEELLKDVDQIKLGEALAGIESRDD